MQYMTEKNYEYHTVVENCTDSDLANRTIDYNKCYKPNRSNHQKYNKVRIQDDHLFNLSILKPCKVVLRRLDLMGHNGNLHSNCCYKFPQMAFKKKLVTNEKNYNLEHGNSMIENRSENSSEKRKNSHCEDLQLIVESLCENFRSVECRKYDKTKNVNLDAISSYTSKERIKNAPIELSSNVYRVKQFAETCERLKPCIISSSLKCKTSDFPKLKSTINKFGVTQNFKNITESSKESYEENGSEIDNEIPLNKDRKNFQTTYLSSNERYINPKTKVCESPKNNCSLLANQRNNHDIPFIIPSVGTPKFSVKNKVDNALQADVLIVSSNNSNQNCALNPKLKGIERAENDIDKNSNIGIEVLKKHLQNKLKGTIKNSVDTEWINKDSECLSNHKTKSVQKSDSILVKNNEFKLQFLEECVAKKNLNETNKYSVQKNAERIERNIYIRKAEYSIENTVRNKQMLEPTNFLCNTDVTVDRAETKSRISLKEIGSLHKLGSSTSLKDLSISSRIPKISNEILRSKQFLNVPQISLDEQCYVLVPKLSIKSLYNKNSFSSNVSDENGRCTSEIQVSTHPRKNSYFPSKTTEDSKISNLKVVSNLTLMNKQGMTTPRKTSEIKRCSVSVEKLSDEEYLKQITPLKSSINSQDNIVKLKRHFFTTLQYRRKLCLQRSKIISRNNNSILNQRRMRNLIKAYKSKKWKRKTKEIPEKCKKYRQVNADLNVNKCENADKVSSTLLKANQSIYNTSAIVLPQFYLNSALHCHVLIKKINVKYLNADKYPQIKENDLRCSKSSNIVPKCLMGNCSVLLKRLNVDKYLVNNKSLHLESEKQQNQDKNLPGSNYATHDKYKTNNDFVQNFSPEKLERKRPLSTEESDVKKIKIKDNHTLQETVINHSGLHGDSETAVSNSNLICNSETVPNTSNLVCDSEIIVDCNFICDSHYKCVQCSKSIINDIELYNHLCCGKKKKGYICDICERIFETVPHLKNHIIEIHPVNRNDIYNIIN